MPVSIETIKSLRDQSGAGVMDCKQALDEAEGNTEIALKILHEKGISAASKKTSRAANEGLVESYVHNGGQIGAIVEINCETDFVARTPEFKALAHDIAMQVAAMAPIHIDDADVPGDDDSISHDSLLLNQTFIRDPSKTMQDLISEAIGKFGENIVIRRFTRFSLGD